MSETLTARNFEIVRQKLESLSKEGFEQDRKIVNLQEQLSMLAVRANAMENELRILRAMTTGTGPSVRN